ncbi:MAG: IS21 family transposase [Bacteroidota bacterium]
MSYKRIIAVEILEIIRRHFTGQNISQISSATSIDRKTVRKYISEVKQAGIREYDRQKVLELIENSLPKLSGRAKKITETLELYKEEINELINNESNPLKPKTVFEVIKQRHLLEDKVSYSSFKRFVRKNKLTIIKDKTTCRMEYLPGQQVQIDYGKMGTIIDPLTNKRRTVYAFIGTLSYSRHKYVQFVYSQSQQSFVNSHVNMFNFFCGAPKILVIDNLKSGVIKPDLYNPVINKAYAEMAEHYQCFINPCRVAQPKDKPIVERDVQTIREQFRKLKALSNNITLQEANEAIKDWLKDNYGKREHGTTHLKPIEEFIETEQPKLLPLPTEEFEAAFWKEATVHPDHYIQVQKKAYSIPHQYVGKKVWVKVTHNLVKVYYNEQLIKQHKIPTGYRQTDFNDFPENMKAVMDTGLPFHLRKQARNICTELGELIDKILMPHAFINMRKAQGILSIASRCSVEEVKIASLKAINNYRNITPRLFLSLIEENNEEEKTITISEETTSFIRNSEYFIYNN